MNVVILGPTSLHMNRALQTLFFFITEVNIEEKDF